jgi:Uma2 family endonuclease
MSVPTPAPAGLTIEDLPWPEVELPPTDLPYDDGDKMESPWHFKQAVLLLDAYTAVRGPSKDYFIGANMFVYYSMRQVRNMDYRGPDVFIVNHVDGARERLSWIVWDEDGRYPDVIFELLSPSTEAGDLSAKKQLYEQVFRTPEYYCIAPGVARLMGWRLAPGGYQPMVADERGWLWSEELQLWLGAWRGNYLAEEQTWLRFYDPAGRLVPLPDEAATERAAAEAQRAEAATERAAAEAQRAEAATERAAAEAQRADELAARLAALEAELQRLRGLSRVQDDDEQQ